MDFLFTNTSKAKKLLKDAGYNVSEMEKGNAKDFILDEKQILKIIKGEPDNALETLNKAGKLLKDSWLTRSTGHKEMDFSSIQTTSYINFTKYCYKQLPEIEDAYEIAQGISDEVSEEVHIRITKIWRDLYKCVKNMEGNRELMGLINEELRKPSIERKHDFAEVVRILHDDYKLDTNRVILLEQIDNSKNWMYSHVGKQAKGAGYTIMREMDLLNLGVKTLKPSDTPIGAMTRGSMCASVLVGCLLTALGTHLVGAQLAEAHHKRVLIRMQESLAKTIKEMNSLSKYVMDNANKGKNNQPKEIKVTDEHKQLLSDFLSEQAKIWKPYTTVVGRAYHELFEDNGSREKHWASGKRVSNQKTSSIGKLKLGLANQWMKIKIAK